MGAEKAKHKNMKIKSSKLRDWNTRFEFSAEYNLSDCSAYDLTTAEVFKVAGRRAEKRYLRLGLGYTDSYGAADLRRTISGLYGRPRIGADNILITNGAVEAIFLLVSSLTVPGDNVIIQFPYYPAWPGGAFLNEVEIRPWRSSRNGRFSIRSLENLVDDCTRAIIIGRPQVPDGSFFNDEELAGIIKVAQRNGLYLVADEVCLLLSSGKNIRPVASLYDKGISLGDLSKPFGAGGLRIGWLATADRSVIKKSLPLRGYTTMSNSAPSEYLANLIIKNKDKFILPRLRIAQINYRLLKKFLLKHDDLFEFSEPSAGLTVFVRLKTDVGSLKFCQGLIKKSNTLLVPGSVYGANDYLRIGFGGPPRLFKKGLVKLEEYIGVWATGEK